MEQIQAIKGFADLFPEESRLFQRVEEAAREIFSLYGYGEFRSPVLEYADLFRRSIGVETDVVQKEMFTLTDARGRSLALRPEATAGIMRAFLEHKIHSREAVSKFFTIGPMFRHERPQKGRLRQFHQINCECLGPKEPEADAELIAMLMAFFARLGLGDLSLHINSLGCPSCRPAYRTLLHDHLAALPPGTLCDDCRRRLESNPLRVLDCKAPSCREHTADAPRLLDHNCPDCRAHFTVVMHLLETNHIAAHIDHRLVRGLDYYTRTTFEAVSNQIGAQGSVAGGGRYDGLTAALGGPNIPGLGFACGVERLAMLMTATEMPRPDFYLTAMDESCRETAFTLAQTLRTAGLAGTFGFEPRSVKSAMRQADKSRARYALLLGPDEQTQNTVVLKNLSSGEQISVSMTDAAAHMSSTKEKS